jgi:hypothetical protein
MRSFSSWVVWGIALSATIIAVGAFLKREEISRLLAVNSLFSEEKIVANFSNMDAAFLTAPLARAVDDRSQRHIARGAERRRNRR